jgi:hypothetical protein
VDGEDSGDILHSLAVYPQLVRLVRARNVAEGIASGVARGDIKN